MSLDEALDRRWSTTCPPDPSSTATVRSLVREALRSHPHELVEDAELLAHELCSNAIAHAGTEFTVTIHAAGDVVRVDVRDTGGGTPCIPEPPPLLSGRGLRMVDALATRWGTRREGAETVVWFELECPFE